MILENEIKKWERFLKALRRDDKAAFEELMNACRNYASAAGAATRPIITEAMFMSILLAHQKTLKEIKAAVERLRSSLLSK
ncbi:MAG: hypothetical protein GTO54_12155 [Nitrososphaeria archaeon]|nr:hypothetical protein [Nitrososphaeria archaeon]